MNKNITSVVFCEFLLMPNIFPFYVFECAGSINFTDITAVAWHCDSAFFNGNFASSLDGDSFKYN